jgi:hypothetical protein
VIWGGGFESAMVVLLLKRENMIFGWYDFCLGNGFVSLLLK